jgi:hypothetical protein
MNNYEKRLLSHLQEDNSQSKNDPLANIKNAMGEIAYSAGNPLTKTEISLQITTNNFSKIGATPNVPIYLFGLTDYYSGYPKSLLITPPNGLQVWYDPTIPRYYFGIIGKDIPFNGLGILGLPLEKGDLFIAYIDDPIILNTFAAVRVHCTNVAYGTFLNSFVSDLITLNMIRLIVPIANINQFIHPLKFTYQDLFGKTTSDSIDPRMYITSTDFQQQICDIPINLPIDKQLMLTFEMDYVCPAMSVILFVEKVEPLTHKSNLSKNKQ